MHLTLTLGVPVRLGEIPLRNLGDWGGVDAFIVPSRTGSQARTALSLLEQPRALVNQGASQRGLPLLLAVHAEKARAP